MEVLNGGQTVVAYDNSAISGGDEFLNKDTCAKAAKPVAIIGGIAGIGSMFGPVGLAIFGPTALAMSAIGIGCAFS